jgi:hypothetical protein
MNIIIESEIAAAVKSCRAAFRKYPNAKYAWCCHHEKLAEPLIESPKSRIKYILRNKAKSEQVRRFNNFRPVTDEGAFQTAQAEYDKVCQTALGEWDKIRQIAEKPLLKLYRQDVPMGTWNGITIL